MKHIKKKFRFDNSDILEKLKISNNISIYNTDTRIDRRFLKDKFILLKHNSGKEILSFPMKYNNETFLMPIPDYPLMYYNHAYMLNPSLNISKKNLLNELRRKSKDRSLCDAEIYECFGHLTSFILNLHCSLESFVNRCIANKSFNLKLKKNEFEIVDSQKNMPLFDKIKIILPR